MGESGGPEREERGEGEGVRLSNKLLIFQFFLSLFHNIVMSFYYSIIFN